MQGGFSLGVLMEPRPSSNSPWTTEVGCDTVTRILVEVGNGTGVTLAGGKVVARHFHRVPIGVVGAPQEGMTQVPVVDEYPCGPVGVGEVMLCSVLPVDKVGRLGQPLDGAYLSCPKGVEWEATSDNAGSEQHAIPIARSYDLRRLRAEHGQGCEPFVARVAVGCQAGGMGRLGPQSGASDRQYLPSRWTRMAGVRPVRQHLSRAWLRLAWKMELSRTREARMRKARAEKSASIRWPLMTTCGEKKRECRSVELERESGDLVGRDSTELVLD